MDWYFPARKKFIAIKLVKKLKKKFVNNQKSVFADKPDKVQLGKKCGELGKEHRTSKGEARELHLNHRKS